MKYKRNSDNHGTIDLVITRDKKMKYLELADTYYSGMVSRLVREAINRIVKNSKSESKKNVKFK